MGSCPRSKTMLSAFRGTVALRRCAATAVLDWGAIASKISTDSGKTELAALRMEMAEVNKALDSVPSGEASVDFAHWRSRIQTPGAVDQFEAAFSGLQVPTLEDTFTGPLTSAFDAAVVSAQVLADSSSVRITELEAEVEAVKVAKAGLHETTVADQLAANPAIAAEIEAELADNEWLKDTK